MTDPDETANLIAEILAAYREHAAAGDAAPADGEDTEQHQADEDDPDCE